MKPILDIILVLYGDRGDLDLCVKSIEEHCKDYELIIIDNNKENRGFTAAVNKGALLGSAPYIWLLSQDSVVLKGAQEALINRFDEKTGIVGSMQLDPENKDIIKHSGTIRCFPAGLHKGGRISMGHGQIPEKQTWVNGASMMIKRAVFEEVGPLDETMFLLYSESDYCYMVREAGYDVWYEPRSQIIHKLGKASKSTPDWQRKDMAAFMEKWGIQMLPDGRFQHSKRFQKLDLFP